MREVLRNQASGRDRQQRAGAESAEPVIDRAAEALSQAHRAVEERAGDLIERGAATAEKNYLAQRRRDELGQLFVFLCVSASPREISFSFTSLDAGCGGVVALPIFGDHSVGTELAADRAHGFEHAGGPFVRQAGVVAIVEFGDDSHLQ
jgi:hypothetical protein